MSNPSTRDQLASEIASARMNRRDPPVEDCCRGRHGHACDGQPTIARGRSERDPCDSRRRRD